MTYGEHMLNSIRKLAANKVFQVAAGIASGILIILFAVTVSVLMFGAYGLGLFVLTPLVVGLTTGYLVNRREILTMKETCGTVLLSAFLGCAGLILFALEGLICLIMASPLAALLAIAGGSLGRRIAQSGKGKSGPIYCIALLPAMFAFDAANPPSVILQTNESIVINASAAQVWQVVTSDEPIHIPANMAGRMGLAFPEKAELSGEGVGAKRIGYFSTGIAGERIPSGKRADCSGLKS
ncbi:MAG: hypothetical protein P8J20_15765 [Novosphingobium sp.]|nr:hypothetical protein [Novosphingobium sp.]